MNIQVMYQDNIIGEIDPVLLDRMIKTGKVKMFMRSDGWAMIGISQMRGDGGPYAGIDRRGRYGPGDEVNYNVIT